MASRLFQFRYSYERDLIDLQGKVQVNSPSVSPPILGSLADYGTVASSTITNTAFTVINGDLGLSPGTSVTGFPPGIVNGTQHITDAAAAAAQVELTTAYLDLQSRASDANYSGTDLGTLTLGPGVYTFNTSAQLTGTLVLDGGGDPDAVFVFQIGSTLTTASASVVSLINGAQAGNVFWQVGSSATLGTTTSFKGIIMAQASITMNTNANIDGSVFARTGAVTLDDNNINVQSPIVPAQLDQVILEGKGILEVVRNDVGDYTVFLKDRHYLFMDSHVTFISGSSAPNAPIMNVVSEDVNGVVPSLNIQLRNLSGNPADPASGEIMLLKIKNRIAST